MITKEKIDCDFEKSPSYLFTNDSANIQKLERQYLFLKENHIEVKKEKLEKIPNKFALKVEDTYKVVEETIEKVESEEDNATN